MPTKKMDLPKLIERFGSEDQCHKALEELASLLAGAGFDGAADQVSHGWQLRDRVKGLFREILNMGSDNGKE